VLIMYVQYLRDSPGVSAQRIPGAWLQSKAGEMKPEWMSAI
jgi:hypothetical protein